MGRPNGKRCMLCPYNTWQASRFMHCCDDDAEEDHWAPPAPRNPCTPAQRSATLPPPLPTPRARCTPMTIPLADLTSYYRAARVALHFVEARRPAGRRFGPAADARWKAFSGGLNAAARLDLLIRDANAEWPGAFGARATFALDSVAEDDAFGPTWPALDGVVAEGLWREPSPSVGSASDALTSLASVWGVSLAPFALPAIDAAERLWVAGPSAIAALALLFAERRDLDWAAQVTCVATAPAHRQLAAFAAALSDGKRPAALVSGAAVKALPAGVTVIISDDAAPIDKSSLRPGS